MMRDIDVPDEIGDGFGDFEDEAFPPMIREQPKPAFHNLGSNTTGSKNESKVSMELQPQDKLLNVSLQKTNSKERKESDMLNLLNDPNAGLNLNKGESIKSDPSAINSGMKKQISTEMLENEAKIKKKSPSQQEDSGNQTLSQNKESDKLVLPKSQIIKSHSYQSNSNSESNLNDEAASKGILNSTKEKNRKMYSEEEKLEEAKRDSFSHPPTKIKRKEISKKDPLQRVPNHSSNNTQNLIGQHDDTNANSMRSNVGSHIE